MIPALDTTKFVDTERTPLMASQGPPAIPRPYIVTSTSKALLAAKAFGHFVSGLKSDAPPLTGKPARRLFDQLYERFAASRWQFQMAFEQWLKRRLRLRSKERRRRSKQVGST